MKHVLAIVLTLLTVSCARNNKAPDKPPAGSPSVLSVKATSNMAKQALRFYGGPTPLSTLPLTRGLDDSFAVKSPLLCFQNAPTERFRPQAVVAGSTFIPTPWGGQRKGFFIHLGWRQRLKPQ